MKIGWPKYDASLCQSCLYYSHLSELFYTTIIALMLPPPYYYTYWIAKLPGTSLYIYEMVVRIQSTELNSHFIVNLSTVKFTEP